MRWLPLCLVFCAAPLTAQRPDTLPPPPATVNISAGARAYMGTIVRADTLASFCGTDTERVGDELRIYTVSRTVPLFSPRCGDYLPILARPRCFIHVLEIALPRFLLICDEGKFLVDRRGR